jgi:hypothetical protein
MPYCEECAKYWAPSAMRPDGTCPRCNASLEDQRAIRVTSRSIDLKSLAGSTRTEVETDEDKAPWHFKLLMVALVLYLGWRLVDVFV